MSAKSSRPEPGWYVAREGSVNWVIVVDALKSVWVPAHKTTIYYYDVGREPTWGDFELESVHESMGNN